MLPIISLAVVCQYCNRTAVAINLILFYCGYIAHGRTAAQKQIYVESSSATLRGCLSLLLVYFIAHKRETSVLTDVRAVPPRLNETVPFGSFDVD